MPAPLLILDTATLYYRAFYALPEKMTAPDGHPHNAVRGFLTMLGKLISIHGQSGLVAAWDTDWRPEWRVALIPSYKTHRLMEPELEVSELKSGEDIPDTLGPQISAIAQILDACGIARIGCENFEADDVIASVAFQNKSESLVVTSDRDLLQVVSDRTSLLLQSAGGLDGWPIINPDEVRSRFGIRPDQYIDYAVLRGDPSDGLPGVSGIGEKTSANLISAFGSMESLRAACRSDVLEKPLTPRIAQRIQESGEYLEAAMSVVRAEVNLPVQNWDTSIPSEPRDRALLRSLGEEWGVTKYIHALYHALDG